MNTIIILGVLLVLLVTIITIRVIEIRKQRWLSVTVVISGFDPFFARMITGVIRSAFGVFVFVRAFFRERFVPFGNNVLRHLHLKAHRTVKKTQKIIKGERRLDNQGSVNFFFHAMSADKKAYVSQAKEEK